MQSLNNNVLISKIGVEPLSTYKEIIKELSITDRNEYLTENEVKSFFDLYRHKDIDTNRYNRYIQDILSKHRRLKYKYPDFNELIKSSSLELRNKFKEFKLLKVLLIYIISGRISVNNHMNIMGLFVKEDILTYNIICKIREACEYYNYSINKTYNNVIKYICRIMIVKNISFNNITLDNIYECYKSKQDPANATTNVLKYLGVIDDSSQYNINKRDTFRNIKSININVESDYYKREYREVVEFVEMSGFSKSDISIKKRVVKLFINWINNQFGEIDFKELEFQLCIEFLIDLKQMKNTNGSIYNNATYLTMRSQLKYYIDYLIIKKKINNKFLVEYYKTEVFEGAISDIKYI